MSIAFRRHYPTILAGCFAMVWVILRANVQSMTLDESDSYLGYVLTDWPAHWYPTSGNHVLNSILTRLLTWALGVSHLTVRGPALAGAAIYILAIYRICTLIADEEWLIFPLFVCFVYNPFTMDYMVAARGYSLALGFLLMALFLLLREVISEDIERLPRSCGWASACLALSFSANFSFGYVDFFGLALFIIWKWTWFWRQQGWKTVWPGLVVFLAIPASVVLDWPKGQLYFGSTSLSELWRSLLVSSFYELNQVLVNPLLVRIFQGLQPSLPYLAFLGFVLQLILKPRGTPLAKAAIYVSGLVAVTLLFHWLQFKLFKIPLPKERTGIFLVTLPLLAFGIATAMPASSAISRMSRTASAIVLWIAALYFIGCLRVVKFHEWAFGSDVRAAFPVILDLSRRQGIHEFPTAWHYSSSLEFYRQLNHAQQIQPFSFTEPPPSGKQAYVLPYNVFAQFIQEEGLRVVYHGTFTDLVIAVRSPAK